MEDDIGVRKLVELIFFKNFQISAEIASKDSSFPPCLLTNDFPEKLKCILLIRQSIVSEGWRIPLENNSPEGPPTPVHYLTFLMGACLLEHNIENKVFESFLSTCGLLRFFSKKMFQLMGMNFWDLNSDIFLEFYDSVLKKSFLKRGGFQQFVGYIHRHKYLKWNLNVNDLAPIDDLSGEVDDYVAEKIGKESLKEIRSRTSGIDWRLSAAKYRPKCDTLVQKILLTASDKLDILTSSHDSNPTEEAINRNELATLTSSHDSNPTEEAINHSGKTKPSEENLEIKEAALKSGPSEEFSRCFSLNSDSKTNHATEQKEYAEKNESIVQRVVNYNHSTGSDLGNFDNQLLKEAKGILNNLENTIKSVINVLDEYEEE